MNGYVAAGYGVPLVALVAYAARLVLRRVRLERTAS
jgi:hypothetical protein